MIPLYEKFRKENLHSRKQFSGSLKVVVRIGLTKWQEASYWGDEIVLQLDCGAGGSQLGKCIKNGCTVHLKRVNL